MSAEIVDFAGARKAKAEGREVRVMAESVGDAMRERGASIDRAMAAAEWRFTARAGAIHTLESAIRAIKVDRAAIAATFARCALGFLDRIESDRITLEKDLATAKRRESAWKGVKTRERKARERAQEDGGTQ
jgi:hypothetical protein